MSNLEPYIWGDAAVTYPDWKGTAQLDQRMTGKQLEEIIGLDDGWLVVGLDMGGGETRHDLRVLAVRPDQVPEGGGVLPVIAAQNGGEIPVTEFLVHNVDPYAVLRAITHMFELRLRISSTERLPIRIVEQGDLGL
ncbi:hypothetical protein [Terrabacter sp. NPDC080008]|uniref:hypothetical protein n=1 Tax=Terrabacter sp. NPDC080008 TaxID=3155176 RepID=UPI00344C7EC0